jgi:hypothetical protein
MRQLTIESPAYLDSNPDRRFNANMLHEEPGIPPSSLGTQLSKLYRTNRINRLDRGYYSSIRSRTRKSDCNNADGIEEDLQPSVSSGILEEDSEYAAPVVSGTK